MDVYELFQQIENRIAIAESVRMIGSKRAEKADLSMLDEQMAHSIIRKKIKGYVHSVSAFMQNPEKSERQPHLLVARKAQISRAHCPKWIFHCDLALRKSRLNNPNHPPNGWLGFEKQICSGSAILPALELRVLNGFGILDAHLFKLSNEGVKIGFGIE